MGSSGLPEKVEPRMFLGFSPETVDFMWGIRMNNERTWFEAHKKDYVTYLYEPMKALGAELFQPYAQVPGMLLKVSRIYKDARMHPAEPYKDGLWLSIRAAMEDWTQCPTLYFDIHPEQAEYGFGLWRPTPAMMERFRRDVAARPQVFPALLAKAERESGVCLQAETYKRPKPGAPEGLEKFFTWKGIIMADVCVEPGEELFTPALAERVAEFFRIWTPVMDYFTTLAQAE